MTHPKSEDVLKVIENFKLIPERKRMEKDSLDMMEPDVTSYGHACGTVHCHAGWYAAVNIKKFPSLSHLTFFDGANLLTRDIFPELNEIDQSTLYVDRNLPKWATDNPQIWGNEDGGTMFCDEYAFYHETKRPEGAKSVQDIIDHWQEVYERLLVLEGKASAYPAYKDITKELAETAVVEEVSDLVKQKEQTCQM